MSKFITIAIKGKPQPLTINIDSIKSLSPITPNETLIITDVIVNGSNVSHISIYPIERVKSMIEDLDQD